MDNFIPISKPSISKKEEAYVLDAVQSGWVSSIGRYIEAFETKFAEYCGVKHALATSNGTTCLHLALAAVGIRTGDEVIIPDLTFIATANAVTYTGATPVTVDIDSDTLCMSQHAVERAITPKTKAIIPVHLYGHPVDMDPLRTLADAHGLSIVEDAAEAHGAEYKGRRVGSLGRCGVFSFYGNKIITTGEGGMLTTDDTTLYLRAKSLRDHAMSSTLRYWHDEIGFNYRITNLQAALGLAQIERINEFVDRRIEIMQWYRETIKTSDEIRLNFVADWAKSTFWMVCLEVDWFDQISRANFIAALRNRGIDSRPYFYPVSSMPMYFGHTPPIAARKSMIGLNLPTYYGLTQEDVKRVGNAVNEELQNFASATSWRR